MNILNKLTIKHLKMNKKRTIVTIIGVVLSTALMIGIGLLFSSIRDNSIKMIIRDQGSQHVVFQNVLADRLDIISRNNKVKKVTTISPLGYAKIESMNEYKPYLYLVSGDAEFLKTLTLSEGRLPQNKNEIVLPMHFLNSTQTTYKIGDVITLEMIQRYAEGKEILANNYLEDEEYTQEAGTRQYTIVGKIERPYLESYSAPGYTCFTTEETTTYQTAFITYKNPKSAYQITESLAQQVGFQNVLEGSESKSFQEVSYNDTLSALYGQSRYSNLMNSLSSTIVIILTLIGIGCTIVIYNSFAISVMERKKQFGLFSSIGATKKQLRKTVFFEALVIGVIGIPIGVLGGFVGIGCVLKIINWLLPDIFGVPLALAAYPTFIIIPLCFMVVVILLSAYWPAKRASRITPIEAIRQNDDIKIQSRKIKTRKWVKRIFGIEGELALKNIKRNKKKYRITVVSLFISIVLFISFSGLLEYGIHTARAYTNLPDYDLLLYFYDQRGMDQLPNFVKTIEANEQTKEFDIVYNSYTQSLMMTSDISSKDWSKEYRKYFPSAGDEGEMQLKFWILDQQTYETYRKKIGASEHQPIVVNRVQRIVYQNANRISIDIPAFATLPKKIQLCRYNEDSISQSNPYDLCDTTLENYAIANEYPLGVKTLAEEYDLVVLISEQMMGDYHIDQVDSAELHVVAPKANSLDKEIKALRKSLALDRYMNYYNVQEELKVTNNMFLVLKILLYGFITLVTLIGVTSVFNTINTSISLRRKEFAMLRSMGLTPKGFNKILYLESLFFGLKSLLYALPVSIAVIYLLSKSLGGIVPRNHLLIPWMSIFIATIGVFLIVLMTMMYASKKIKKENILNAIREENI